MATAITKFPPTSQFEPPHTAPHPKHQKILHVSSRVLGQGSCQKWVAGTLDEDRVAVCLDSNRCTDPDILAMRSVYQQRHEAQAFAMDQDVCSGNMCIKIAPLLDGEGTRYEGRDGFSALCEARFSKMIPYAHDPAKNAIRLAALGIIESVLELHKCAREAEVCRFVHGDIKLEQFVIDTLQKAGVTEPYARLVLIDIPSKIEPKERTPFFCPHGTGPTRFHYEDLFALKATLGRLLYRVLTEPVFEGDVDAPFDVDHDLLAEMLIAKREGGHYPKEVVDAEFAAGYPVVTDRQGNYYVYPGIFNDKVSSQFLDDLDRELSETPDSPYVTLAYCLLECIMFLDKDIEKGRELRMDPQAAQEHLIGSLENLTGYIRYHFLPLAGPSGSPQKDLAPRSKKARARDTAELDSACKTLHFGADDAPKQTKRPLSESTNLTTQAHKVRVLDN